MIEGGCVQGDDGPCSCGCHDDTGVKCFAGCCRFAGMSRVEAASVAILRAGEDETSVDDPIVKMD